jgi:hypothetical protein
MLRADGTPWINSFAHGRTVFELKLDAAAVRAAVDAIDKEDEEEIISTFVRLALRASLTAVEAKRLTVHVNKLTGCGVNALNKTLKEAEKERGVERARAEYNRRAAERKDPRPLLPAAEQDAPWLPQMAAYNGVLGSVGARVPPTRDISGDATRIQKIVIADTHAFTSEGATP